MKNQFCELASLRNEADVEQSFARRLLEKLGYADNDIVPKASLSELSVGGMRGHAQRNYKPDFALRAKGKVRWIVEAKSPGERLDDHEWQARAYCVLLNGDTDGAYVRYYILTNGIETRLYDPSRNAPLVVAKFEEMNDGSPAFEEIKKRVDSKNILKEPEPAPINTIRLEKKSLSEVNAAFSWCHQHIYKKDNVSQSDAFTEFVKLISLKLMSDRRVRDRHAAISSLSYIDVPSDDVQFSVQWIDRHDTPNPISDVQFAQFMREMERDITLGKRKRIFEENDVIGLRPETIRGVVKRLEGIYLFGIDADLNGRLFETFLNATMRGKDLGQFFTPRSLVKLGVKLSDLKVNVPDGRGGRHTDVIVDACCGSGGFLIDVLADMWAKADRMQISDPEKAQLKWQIANKHIVGIDIANAPKLARIARLNMYLHGDGGTRIFQLNALDKKVRSHPADPAWAAREKEELRSLLAQPAFDIALTNPPFAKALERSSEDENAILDDYEIGRDGGAVRQSVRSALLFLERYRDVLKPGGRLVTIIDDGILSGDDYAWFREKLKEWFLIRAVVSLPGDAFQRSNARVKTSYLVAERRARLDQEQGPVFMYPCRYVGLDDPKRQRARAGDAALRRAAEEEIRQVWAAYEAFLSGSDISHSVAPDRIEKRLDVKNCLVAPGRRIADWKAQGMRIVPLAELVKPRRYEDEEVVRKDHPEAVRVLVVRYEGSADASDEIYPADGSYAKLYPVRAGDVVISNIAASHGSIAVVPEELDGSVVSSEYTVLEPLAGVDPNVVQLVLRSPEVRSEILLSASGANRTRTRWSSLKGIMVPYPDKEIVEAVNAFTSQAEEAARVAEEARNAARLTVESALLLTSDEADTILAAFKPPK